MENKIRNEVILQNYSPNIMKIYLSGKTPNTNKLNMQGDLSNKEYWIDLFEKAIEDLQAGNIFKGKIERNEVGYWRRQIKIAKSFEPKKYEYEQDVIDLSEKMGCKPEEVTILLERYINALDKIDKEIKEHSQLKLRNEVITVLIVATNLLTKTQALEALIERYKNEN